MSDLAAALERFDSRLPVLRDAKGIVNDTTEAGRSAYVQDALLLIAAARQRLRLSRDENGVWPAELVEGIAATIWTRFPRYELSYPEGERIVRAVLDAVESWMEAT